MRWIIGTVIFLIVVLGGWIAYPFLVPPVAPKSEEAIIINKALNRLYYYTDGHLQNTYSVATGREPDLTPEGNFQIVTKTSNQAGLGAEGIFGTRWMGLSVPGHEDGTKYGIHGTNEPNSIGEHASAGCIRMGEADLEQLYELIPIGTPVRIVPGTLVHRYIVNTFMTQ